MQLNDGAIYARNQYYIFNSFQGVAVFASAGGSALYWSYLLQKSSGTNFITFSFTVGMAIMAVLEGAKFLMQRDDTVTKKQFLPFVFFSVLTGLATLMISAELITAKKIKQSSLYQQAENSSQTAVQNKAKYAWAKNIDISHIEAQAESYKQKGAFRANGKLSGLTIGAVLSNPTRYRSYQHYQKWLDDLQKKIDAKRAYLSASISESDALEKMGKNAGGSANPKITDSFDWFIQSIKSITTLSGLHSLLLIYLFAMTLVEIAGAWFGRNAYLYGLEYRRGKEAVRKTIAINKYGFDPMQTMQVIEDLTDKLTQSQTEKIKLISEKSEKPLALESPEKTNPKKTFFGLPKTTRPTLNFSSHIAPQNPPKNPIGFTAHIVTKKAQCDPDIVPKKAQKNPLNVTKQSQNIVTPKLLKNKRKSVTADTGTEGENSKRYQALKKEVVNGHVKGSIRGIMTFKYGGRGMGRSTAEKYRNALKKEGVIS